MPIGAPRRSASFFREKKEVGEGGNSPPPKFAAKDSELSTCGHK